MARKAINDRWEISEEQRASVIKQMIAIIEDPSASNRDKIGAGKTLAVYDKTNIDSHPKQTHSINLNLNLEEQRKLIAEKIQSLRDGTVDDGDE